VELRGGEESGEGGAREEETGGFHDVLGGV
jgi:hypothetical protein